MSPSAESASGCVQMPLQILPNNPFRACNLALLVPRTPPINDYSLVMTQGEGRRTTPEPETLTALDFFRAEHPDPLASLNATHRRLQSCDYYYATTNSAQAQRLLDNEATGTFLLRDSSDPRYHYALTVQTSRGATSVRISYANSRFKLDCSTNSEKFLPSFDCVISLITYYTSGCKDVPWSLRETDRNRDTTIILRYPLLRRLY